MTSGFRMLPILSGSADDLKNRAKSKQADSAEAEA